MTDFEQQLVKAIEHGCPECGSKNILDIYDMQDTPIRVVCDDSEDPTHILWTSGDGWIPELQEAVK